MTNHPNRSRRADSPARNPRPEDIRAAREAAGLTQTQAAALIYAGRRACQEWEAGTRRLHPGLWELFHRKLQEPTVSDAAYTVTVTTPADRPQVVIDAWAVAAITPCGRCGGALTWAEAGHVPGHRTCEHCGLAWIVRPRTAPGSHTLVLTLTPDGEPSC